MKNIPVRSMTFPICEGILEQMTVVEAYSLQLGDTLSEWSMTKENLHTVCSVMSEKRNKKWGKKQKRISHMLYRDTGINTCEKSRFLMVCNAGLVSGLQREEVVALFATYGVLENVIMLPGKSYCFVAFCAEEDAGKAFLALHGKYRLHVPDVTLFLVYSEQVPLDELERTNSEWPTGLKLIHDFISEDEEERLLKCVKWGSGNVHSGKSLKHRRVKHYGYEFRYDNNNVDKDDPLPEDLPDECSFIKERMFEATGHNFEPDQLTVNEYQPGQGIPSHVDTHSAFEDIIASLSLGSSVVMDFKHDDGRHVGITLPQRSLLVMTGESRYAWAHGITPRKLDVVRLREGESMKESLSVCSRGIRTSFTLRRILRGECFCAYHDQCDSHRRRLENVEGETVGKYSQSMNEGLTDDVASKLETMHVQNVYEEIASHFSDTRHKAWPNVMKFVENLPVGSILLDVGCGNGKYFGINKGIFEVGCDQSSSLCEVVKDRGYQIFACNCLHIPLRPEVADACICIAVIHHLSTKERRLQSLAKIVNVLRSGGQALVYVWAKEQERERIKSTYLYQMGKKSNKEGIGTIDQVSECQIPGLNISLPVHRNRTDFKHTDLLVPWKLNGRLDSSGKEGVERQTFLRYYHVFQEGELESLCNEIPGVKVIKTYYDQGNWCVLIEKEF